MSSESCPGVMTGDKALDLSVVIPVYNEVDNVRRLHEELVASLADRPWSFEIIFVDDGSGDGTLPVLRSVAKQDPRVRVIRLRGNYGQTAAMRAGIEHARGGIIVTMDGDLQNDPHDIPCLVNKIEEGNDLVTGWRRDRKDPFLSRKLPSHLANWVIRRVTGVPIHDTGCSLKAYRAELIRRVPLYAELHRFIPAMSTLASLRFAEVVVRHHPRRHGKSKYGLARIGRVVLDVLTVKMLITSSYRPLHWFGKWAVGAFVLSLFASAAWLYVALAGAHGVTIVPPVVTFLLAYLAVHLLLAGVFAELVVGVGPTDQIEPMTRCRQITGAAMQTDERG